MKNSVYVLWLEGMDPESLSTLPSLSKLAKHGVDLHLTPSPLVEKEQCYYQTLTGMGPGRLGRFDSVWPEGYAAWKNTGVPEGAMGHTLPDVLRMRKLAVTSLEARDKSALDAVAGHDFALIRVPGAGNLAPDALDAMVQQCIELATPASHVLVLTDVWSPAPNAFVNVNDFLAEVGLLEVGESRTRADITWSETLAYGLGTGQVWINLRGREQQGTVGSGREYQEVCDALIRELSTNWLDPQTQKPVVERVLKKDEAYKGEYLFKAPDLITVYRPGYAPSEKAFALDLDGHSVRSGEQSVSTRASYARLIASGPSLENGFTAQAALLDVVPSVMYLLGLAIPCSIDGEVVMSMFTQAYRQQTPMKHVEDDEDLLSDEEEGLIVDRLRDLGYLG